MMAAEYGVLHDETQARAMSQLVAQCFLAKPEDCDEYLDRIGRDRFRILSDGSQVRGGLALLPMAQWWHGNLVPMTGIAAVGVAPEYRGSGTAIALIRHMLRELYDQQTPLSVLYPATQRLYRKAGYEQAGSQCRWEVPLAQIHIQERSLPWFSLEPTAEILTPLYRQKAQIHNGHLDRASAIWVEILRSKPEEMLHAYGVGAPDSPQGYLLFTQKDNPSGATLHVRDWVALTPAAGRSLWSFAANHRSQVHHLRVPGGLTDPLLLLLPEQTARLASSISWMLRLVHVPRALEQRGYPALLETELHLEIRDEVLPENQGRFTLAIAHGSGTVTPGGSGALKIDIRGLSALYAGHATPYALHQIGLLDGDGESLAIASQIFATSPAWMPDFF
ncbi:MAG: GNAT family N-acetyltransferase [Synechococcales cyanobacterium T60_A2020_003]|nr:GNAT family N-acetyltransferase [Synechococcales cyanobacterium T60_A2020_003]